MGDFLELLDDGPKKKRKLNGHIVDHLKSKYLYYSAGGMQLIIYMKKDIDETIDEDVDAQEQETADEKRLRMAQDYIDRIASVEEEDNPDADLIAHRLAQEAV